MKKILPVIILAIITLISCETKNFSSKEGIENIQKSIKENLDGDFEVYQLVLSAPTLSGNIDCIRRVYKVKNIFFKDEFVGNGFTDPVKILSAILLNRKKPFKIKEVDVSGILIKYKEALLLLQEKGLLKDDTEYILNNWVFEKDRAGNMFSEFTLQFVVGHSTSGKRSTTHYNEHSFKVDKNNKLIFIK